MKYLIDYQGKKFWVELDAPPKRGVCDACLPEGESILINNELRPIEEAGIGDVIFGINGYQNIKQKYIRPYKGKLITINAMGLLPFNVTPEHPILICERICKDAVKNNKHTRTYFFINFKWVPAGDLTPMDNKYLVFPKHKYINPTIKLNMQTGNLKKWNGLKEVELTEEFSEFLGLYLAEGHSENNKRRDNSGVIGRSVIDLGIHEEALLDRLLQLIRVSLGRIPIIKYTPPTVRIVVNSATLATFLKSEFGHLAPNKKIPRFMMDAPQNIVRSFLIGWINGDGYIKPNGNIIISTTSKIVAIQSQKLFSKLDIFASIYKVRDGGVGYICGRRVNMHAKYAVCITNKYSQKLFLDKQYKSNKQYRGNRQYSLIGENSVNFFALVSKISQSDYNGLVYNLETPEQSYQVSNILIHNCGERIGKEIKVTQTHHFKYAYSKKQIERNPQLAMDNTAELGFNCHKLGNALMNLLSVKLENVGSIVKVAKLMPNDMKLKMDKLCKLWLHYREKETITP